MKSFGGTPAGARLERMKASPRWAGERFRNLHPILPGLRDPSVPMPPIDLVAVSHDHYDHLDYPTIRELAKLEVPFVTSLGVGAHLERWGVSPERITELDWWEVYKLPKSEVTVTAAPSQPGGGR
jgi:L-ascorbate metabolism protein UlaG (beta-lactamase superfamily)